jgi:3-hydroxyisobutyrate dehydrogenase-like beta-hydroxyacid dehydrogenase
MGKEGIAFIGLGTMGKPMAMNLCKAGYPLTVLDLNPVPVSELVALGARSVDSPRQAAEKVEVIIVMVWDGDQTKEVMLGEKGAISNLKKGGIVLLMNTIEPSVIRDIAVAAEKQGIAVLDAPVSGGQVRAQSGTLTIMVGGNKATYDTCSPILAAMGNELFYLGGLGAGTTGKLVNNMLAAVHLMATSELVRLGVRAGVDPNLLIDMLKTATGSSNIVRAWKKIDRAFDVGDYFRRGGVWELMQKDIHLALDFARAKGVNIPVSNLAAQLYDSLDFSPGKNPFAS